MPSAIDWVHEISWMKNYRFPLDQGMRTVFECLKDWMDDYNEHIERTSFLTSEEKKKIKEFSNSLLQAHELYLNNQYIDAFDIFNRKMDEIKDYLLTVPVGRMKSYVADCVSYYRMIPGDNNFNLIQSLHIPCTKRHLASSNRFSVPGMPCSYMASAPQISWCECGMPDSFQLAEFVAIKHDKKLVQLDINPLVSIFSLITEFYGDRWNTEEQKDIVIRYCFMFPLVAACSVIAKEKGKAFVEAYIIPQMLMVWIKNSTDFIGVRYYSDCGNELIKNMQDYNIAMPVKKPDEEGYCRELQDIFGIDATNRNNTVGTIFHTKKFFEDSKDQIENLRDYYKRILYIKEHTHYMFQVNLYDEYCSVCVVMLSLLEAFEKELGASKYALVLTLSKLHSYCLKLQREQKESLSSFISTNAQNDNAVPNEVMEEMKLDVNEFDNTVLKVAQGIRRYLENGRSWIC